MNIGFFNEVGRVQMPALVHLSRLGYNYFGKISEKNNDIDDDTNILINIFKAQFKKLNPSSNENPDNILQEIKRILYNNDLGKEFYQKLTSISPIKLIDFENIENNAFHYVAELVYKSDQNEFRPDITLFINGLPLVFIEVKKPNNTNGMQDERERMNKRVSNQKFRRFINITQLMIFSNNMEYDSQSLGIPIQGAFYCTGARKNVSFNCFREENKKNLEVAPFIRNYPYKEINPSLEKKILSDFNCIAIKGANHYKTNLEENSPTNRIITSMCAPE